MVSARCLFLFLLLILIAGSNVILSDDRVYHTSKQNTPLEKLNRRTRDMHLRPILKQTRRGSELEEMHREEKFFAEVKNAMKEWGW
ncbi:hypothetical protein V1264_005167 [Littorina saxatilis]|uniref:Uncharacterized protein n=1 Tax=Littorina saxatilis TaxID=31220 RepID=A0AAN9AZ64_9CAEN